jgi:hypothetical protein
MITLSLKWFQYHSNCGDKGKLRLGFITYNVLNELGFNNSDEFILYVSKNYHLYDYEWYTLSNNGLWVYPEDVLCDITQEYSDSLFS